MDESSPHDALFRFTRSPGHRQRPLDRTAHGTHQFHRRRDHQAPSARRRRRIVAFRRGLRPAAPPRPDHRRHGTYRQRTLDPAGRARHRDGGMGRGAPGGSGIRFRCQKADHRGSPRCAEEAIRRDAVAARSFRLVGRTLRERSTPGGLGSVRSPMGHRDHPGDRSRPRPRSTQSSGRGRVVRSGGVCGDRVLGPARGRLRGRPHGPILGCGPGNRRVAVVPVGPRGRLRGGSALGRYRGVGPAQSGSPVRDRPGSRLGAGCSGRRGGPGPRSGHSGRHVGHAVSPESRHVDQFECN